MKYYDTLADRSVAIAQQVTDSGQLLTAHGYEPLVQLSNQANGDLALSNYGLGCGFAENPLYSAISDAIVGDLGGVLQQVTNVTFNDAVPLIKRILEKLQQVINPDIPVAYTTCDIREVKFNPVWDSPFISEVVAYGLRVEGSHVSMAGMIKSSSDPIFDNLQQLTRTGVGSLNEQVDQITGKLSVAQLSGLFSNVFTHGYLPEQAPLKLITDSDNGEIADRDLWVLILLWARNLASVAPVESAFDLARFQMNLHTLEDMASRVIASVDELRRAQSTSNMLILDIRGNTAVVNGDLYANFLKGNGVDDQEGRGSPEIILGVVVSKGGRKQYTVTEIMADRVSYETSWNNHVKASSASHSQDMNSTARRQLYLIMEAETKERFLGQVEGLDANEVEALRSKMNSCLDRIAEELKNLPTDFIRDTHHWVFKIVADVFYPNSDVCLLLNNLREVGEMKDSGLAPDEVRYIASVNFVADWLASVTNMASSGYTANDLRRSMATESIDWKTIATGVGAAILIGAIGYAAYAMLNRSDRSSKKLEGEINALNAAIAKVEELPARGKVKASALIANEDLKSKLTQLPRGWLEAIAKSGDVSKLSKDYLEAGLIIQNSMLEAFKGFEGTIKTIQGSGSVEDRAKAATKFKLDGRQHMMAEMKRAFKLVFGHEMPTLTEENTEATLDKLRNEINAVIGVSDVSTVEHLFGTDREIDLDAVMRGATAVKNDSKKLTSQLHAMNALQKGNQSVMKQGGKAMDEFSAELKANHPELHKEFMAAEDDDTSHRLLDFVLEGVMGSAFIALAHTRRTALTVFAATKLAAKAE